MTDTGSVRRLKIDMIIDNSNPIMEWFDEYWKDMLVLEVNTDNGSIFYYKEFEANIFQYRTIFYINASNNKFFWLDHNYWAEISNKFFWLDHALVQQITKILVENKTGMKLEAIPNFNTWCIPHDIDITLNVLLKQ